MLSPLLLRSILRKKEIADFDILSCINSYAVYKCSSMRIYSWMSELPATKKRGVMYGVEEKNDIQIESTSESNPGISSTFLVLEIHLNP